MIKAVHIKNFKSISNLTVNLSGFFHVLIGENNIGKTTIFEAIHLWKRCYDLNLTVKKDRFYSKSRNLPFKDMESIRVFHDMDLFPPKCTLRDAESIISLDIEYNGSIYALGFRICKVSSIDDAYYQVNYMNAEEFKKFAIMVETVPGKTLASFLAISESHPLSNIVAKEPYMYRDQVLDKIAKGKSNEVLRNKIIGRIESVQEHINSVLGANYKITETNKDKKSYISVKVDDKDIFSFGSGFIQLAELFSSIEYLDAEIHLLLIDEPDAHLHVKMQKRLIDELRGIQGCQLIIISHNEHFLTEIDEPELLFMNQEVKDRGIVKQLSPGFKGVVLENLTGVLGKEDELRLASKLVIVEGKTDLDFLEKMKPIYQRYCGDAREDVVIIQIVGIDTLNTKLLSYSRALKGVIRDDCNWIVVRDTDCVPLDKQVQAWSIDKKDVDTGHGSIQVFFQHGYGIESSFVAEPEKFSRLLCSYYSLPCSEEGNIKGILENVNQSYFTRVSNSTDSLNLELERHLNRQKDKRKNKVYEELQLRDVLSQLSSEKIQYIMTKGIMNMYLKDIHDEIKRQFSLGANTPAELTYSNIFNEYYSWISGADDIFESHKKLLKMVYE